MFHCYYKDKILPISECQIPPNDLGLFRSYGIFDFFRTYQKKPFQFDWYWARFQNSARILNIEIPKSKEEVLSIVHELIEKSQADECAIRFILTGGMTENGIDSDQTTFMVFSEPITIIDPQLYKTGIKLDTREYIRDLPEAKSTDYKYLLSIRPQLKQNGAFDVLYHQNGVISELSRSNIFIVNGNTIATPSKNILKGITRKTVLLLASKEFIIEERDVQLTEVLNAEEVFTTSSTKKVIGITQIDDHIIGTGKPGKVTEQLLAQFDEFTRQH
ncbi:aminotransferase class IV [Jiulongibacter sp. NS-SX5]|uniref:aminotransferase class IV n=1 Tax=Jiulongibacter sp. NS-SX5 TaxID=3463854 RepID=UPI004059C6AC